MRLQLYILTLALSQGFLFSLAQDTGLYPEDFLSARFHKERRELFRDRMPENSVAVFFSNPVRNRANDVDYLYHQDPNLYYLTGYREPNAVLLIFKDLQTGTAGQEYNEIFFVQPRDEFAEMWTGRRMGENGVRTSLGLEVVFSNSDFEGYNIDFSNFDPVMFVDFKNDVRDTRNRSDLYDLIRIFKQKSGYPSDTDLKVEPEKNNLDTWSIAGIMRELRGVKTEEELDLLRKAINISSVGQSEVMKAMRPGMSEREVQGIFNLVFRKYGSEYDGYPAIVGAGNNGCILHYMDNCKPVINSDEMILMDLGAEYRGYTADVTRTIPVSGRFSPEQKAIYDLVYEAQEAGMKMAKAGNTMDDINRATRSVINEGLARLGIISSAEARHRYYPHGCCHHIGLDVHDSGMSVLEANMVITIEPGIYIPEGSDCDEKWWGIAVRIEDDYLITSQDVVLLSDMAPRRSDEIEALMKERSILEDFELPRIDDH